ncbi:hypothetical protein ACU4GD_29760 [Cupriavidus basilensis]
MVEEFTWSKTMPLYLEGSIGYNRYDPTYVASNGVDSRARYQPSGTP